MVELEIDKIGGDGFLGLALWLLSTRSAVVVDLLVGFFVVDEISVVGFFFFLLFLFLLVVLVVAVSCGFWL